MVVSFVAPNYVDQPYYIVVDRELFLPTSLLEVYLTETPGLTTLAQLLLLGGDATDDNVIDVADAGCIGGAYGGTPAACGTGGWSDVNEDGVINIAFTGNIGEAQGLSILPITAKLLRDKAIRIRFYIIGEGQGKIRRTLLLTQSLGTTIITYQRSR